MGKLSVASRFPQYLKICQSHFSHLLLNGAGLDILDDSDVHWRCRAGTVNVLLMACHL